MVANERPEERVLWYVCLGACVIGLVLVAPVLLPLYLLGRAADWVIDRVIGGVR